ncbi:MAG: hypothetical protein WD063_09550 [Pirellulales bacterium]
MPIRLPEFSDKYAQALRVCAFAGEASKKKRRPLEKQYLQSSYPTDNGTAWMGLILEDADDDHIHFHIDLAFDHLFDESDKRFETISVQQAIKAIDRVIGLNANAYVCAQYSIPFGDLPKRGILASLLGTSTEVCGSEMCLTGATMNIDGDPFTKLRWQIGEDEDDELCIDVTLEADQVIAEITDDYLIALAQTMRQGIDCFVFESQSDKASHENQPKAMSKATSRTG